MTWTDLLLYGPGWAAIPLMILNRLGEQRFQRRYRERWGIEPGPTP